LVPGFRLGLVTCAVTIVLAAVPLGFGQSAPDSNAAPPAGSSLASSAAFDVASIHLDKVTAGGRITTTVGNSPGGTLNASGVTIRMLLGMAYGVDEGQIVGDPGWLSQERYSLVAKPAPELEEQVAKLDPPQRKLVTQHMLQALLADRLKLTLHQETRELPVLILEVAKTGSKLHESEPEKNGVNGSQGAGGMGFRGSMRMSAGRLSAQRIPMDGLAMHLTARLHHLVVNKTGLKGNYDFTLEWSPEEEGPSMPGEGTVGGESASPSIYTALQEQLGLKLESQKGPVPVLVVDRVERPSEN